MAEPVASLRAQLSLDSATFERGAKRAQQATRNVAGGLAGMGRQANASSRAFGGLGNPLRQTSMQLSQVVQQTQATGNAMQALAIQLPDIGLAFGTMGIFAGIAGGALLSFASTMTGVKEEAKELNAISLDGVRSGISSLADLEQRYEEAIRARANTQSTASDDAIRAIGRELEAKRALFRVEEAQLKVKAEQLRQQIEISKQAFEQEVQAATALVDRSDDTGGFARSRAQSAVLETTLAIRDANSQNLLELQSQVAQLDLIEISLDEIGGAFRDAQDAAQGVAQKTGEARLEVERQEDAIKGVYIEYGNSRIEAERLASVDLASGIAAGANEAERLARGLGVALSTALELSTASPTMQDEDLAMAVSVLPGAQQRERNRQSVANFQRISTAATRTRSSGGRSGPTGPSEAELEAERQREERQRAAARVFDETRTAVERYGIELTELRGLYQEGYLDAEAFGRATEALAENFRNAELEQFTRQIDDISTAFADAIVSGNSLADAFGGIVRRMAADLISSGISSLVRQAIIPIFGPMASPSGQIASNLIASVAGARAMGGPVSAGKTYVVGEKGPEKVTFGADAYVHSNKDSFGQNVHVTVGVDQSGNLQAWVDRKVAEGMRAVGQTVNDRFSARSASFSNDPRRRGPV